MFENETLHKVLVNFAARTITIHGSDGSVRTIDNNDSEQFLNMMAYIKQNAPDGIVEYASI